MAWRPLLVVCFAAACIAADRVDARAAWIEIFGNKGQNLARMNELSQAIRRGENANEALVRVCGGLQAVKDGLMRYIDQSLYVYQRIPADVNVDAKAFAAREVPAGEAALAQARLHAAMGRPVEARQQRPRRASTASIGTQCSSGRRGTSSRRIPASGRRTRSSRRRWCAAAGWRRRCLSLSDRSASLRPIR